MPAQAADHVVVVEQAAMHGSLARRREIRRSGPWLREETFARDRPGLSHSNFASGTTFQIARDPLGAILGVTASRDEPGEYFRYRRTPTGRHDNVLGEDCQVWSLVRIGDADGEGIEVQACETADGIQLWSRALSRRNGTLLSDERAISLERRPVQPGEVLPPADFFSRAPWPTLAGAGAARGYEVVLASTSRGRRLETVVRGQSGAGGSRSDDHIDGDRSYWATDGTRRLSYRAGADGRPLRLSVEVIEAASPRPVRLLSGRWEALPGRRAERVLGERCTWQEETSIRSTDAHYECRTADGVPLMLEDHWHWDSIVDRYRAERVARRPLTGADLSVPAAATDWASWGVAPPR